MGMLSFPLPHKAHFVLTRYTKLVPANSPLAMGMAVGCVAVATVLRFALTAVIGPTTPFITMFPAVLLATVIGGFWPGLLAIALSIVATWYFFFAPGLAFAAFSAGDSISIVFFMLGALLMVLAATSMRRAVERLEEAQEKLLAALDASSTGTWRWDIQRDVVEWDPAMVNVFGLNVRKAPRNVKEFAALVHPDDRDYAMAVVGDAIKTGKTIEFEFRALLPGGEERWIYDRSRVTYDVEKKPLYMIGACLDITGRKRAEERQSLLIHELNHRVKNTLATVQALASQTVRHASDPRGFLSAFSARLQALGAAHSLLSDHEWKSISVRELAVKEIAAFDDQARSRILVEGDDAFITPDQAVGLGMVLHELASNALRFGALSVPQGHVRLEWTVQGNGPERRLSIRWVEVGGPKVEPPPREGFGMILIRRSLAKTIASTVEHEFRPEGVVATISLPLQPTESN